MRSTTPIALAACAATLVITGHAPAGITPFNETFDSNSSGWFDAAAASPLDWLADGGPGGAGDGFARGQFNFLNSVPDDTPTILRAQDEFGSSGNAFVGNWITEGVSALTFSVRHNAPLPLNFFARFSSPFNFPGAVALEFVPVLPNTWTEITVPIDPANPQFISFEMTDFDTVFSNIGHMQFGVNAPAALAGQDAVFNFDIDDVSLVPAPGALAVLLAGVAVGRRRRRD